MRKTMSIAFAAALALTSGIAAQKPAKSPFPYEPFGFSAGVVCPFNLRIEGGGTQSLVSFPGRDMVVGSGDVRVTNSDTGASITLSSSGNFSQSDLGDGTFLLTGSGHSLFSAAPGRQRSGTDQLHRTRRDDLRLGDRFDHDRRVARTDVGCLRCVVVKPRVREGVRKSDERGGSSRYSPH
jgi:hypothetical protein